MLAAPTVRYGEPMTTRPYHHGGRRDALLVKAEETLRQCGVAELSLRELARGIGVSHAAPRRHFRDKRALLDALAVQGFRRMGMILDEAAQQGGSVSDRLVASAKAYVRFAMVNATLLDLMFASKHRTDVSAELSAVSAASYEGLLALVAEGQASGTLRSGDPDHIGKVLIAHLQGITSLATSGMIRPEEVEPLTEEGIRVLLAGLAPAAAS